MDFFGVGTEFTDRLELLDQIIRYVPNGDSRQRLNPKRRTFGALVLSFVDKSQTLPLAESINGFDCFHPMISKAMKKKTNIEVPFGCWFDFGDDFEVVSPSPTPTDQHEVHGITMLRRQIKDLQKGREV